MIPYIHTIVPIRDFFGKFSAYLFMEEKVHEIDIEWLEDYFNNCQRKPDSEITEILEQDFYRGDKAKLFGYLTRWEIYAKPGDIEFAKIEQGEIKKIPKKDIEHEILEESERMLGGIAA